MSDVKKHPGFKMMVCAYCQDTEQVLVRCLVFVRPSYMGPGTYDDPVCGECIRKRIGYYGGLCWQPFGCYGDGTTSYGPFSCYGCNVSTDCIGSVMEHEQYGSPSSDIHVEDLCGDCWFFWIKDHDQEESEEEEEVEEEVDEEVEEEVEEEEELVVV
jgi:hypothetical protein